VEKKIDQKTVCVRINIVGEATMFPGPRCHTGSLRSSPPHKSSLFPAAGFLLVVLFAAAAAASKNWTGERIGFGRKRVWREKGKVQPNSYFSCSLVQYR
jgi:hypothetical protein